MMFHQTMALKDKTKISIAKSIAIFNFLRNLKIINVKKLKCKFKALSLKYMVENFFMIFTEIFNFS